jgi:hypothetical protein
MWTFSNDVVIVSEVPREQLDSSMPLERSKPE